MTGGGFLRPANGKGGPRGLSEGQIAEALDKTGGNVLAAAQALGVTDSAIYQRIANHPELGRIKDEAKARITDMATARVIKRIERDDWSAINLWLTTQAGWVRRSELSGPDGGPVPVAGALHVTVEYVGAGEDPGDVV